MLYKIDWLEKKTTPSGKQLLECRVIGADSSIYDKVSIWGDFPDFATIAPGHSLEGTMYNKPGTKYFTLYPPRNKPVPRTVPAAIRDEARNAQIKEAQERKNNSIAFFNATNSAIEIVNLRSKEASLSDEDILSILRKWRTWFLSEWEEYNK